MKRLILILAGLVMVLHAQNQISGPQSGTLGPGQYVVVGDISVEAGNTLEIAPGTELLHSGHYTWSIRGMLIAKGSDADSIFFIRQNPTGSHRWGGIRFLEGATDSCLLEYCVIDNCKYSGNTNGGGVYCEKVVVIIRSSRISNCELGDNGAGGGIYASAADILVEKCLVTNNSAESGGGISMGNCRGAIVRNNIIAFNKTSGT